MGGTFYKKRSGFLAFRPTNKSRPKTFKTEESANAYAEKMGLTEYTLDNMKSPESSTKKLRIVV